MRTTFVLAHYTEEAWLASFKETRKSTNLEKSLKQKKYAEPEMHFNILFMIKECLIQKFLYPTENEIAKVKDDSFFL